VLDLSFILRITFMTKYFLDTEFIEDGTTISLISIGIVCEDGREFYAVNRDCDLTKASQWVKNNVISKLPPKDPLPIEVSPRLWEESKVWKTKAEIAEEVANFFYCYGEVESVKPTGWNKFLLKIQSQSPIWLIRLMQATQVFAYHSKTKTKYSLGNGRAKPEIWGYYADYDHVVFCQLFGAMIALPNGFPMYTKDIKQLCDDLGNPELPKQESGKHNALADARHNQVMHQFLMNLKQG
jgi:hypothetical protein